MLKGLKVNFVLQRPAVNSKLSQTGMKGHHRAECLEKYKLTVIMGWFEGRPPAGSGAVQVI